MKFYFTKNKKIGSRLIRWGLGEDCSHFAFAPNSDTVLESRMEEGFTESPVAEFLARNEVVHEIEISVTGEEARWIEDSVCHNCLGTKYDELGILWWCAIVLGRKLFGTSTPDRNQWQDKRRFYCVEILKGSEAVLAPILGVTLNLDMLSPYELYEVIMKSTKARKLL